MPIGRLAKVFKSLLAQLLLQSAIGMIQLMRWLYNHGFIDKRETDTFFSVARGLEQFAAKLTGEADRDHDESG